MVMQSGGASSYSHSSHGVFYYERESPCYVVAMHYPFSAKLKEIDSNEYRMQENCFYMNDKTEYSCHFTYGNANLTKSYTLTSC